MRDLLGEVRDLEESGWALLCPQMTDSNSSDYKIIYALELMYFKNRANANNKIYHKNRKNWKKI